MADDEAIQATNDDASECKRYAVQLSYWSDPFINFFVKQTGRKAPEINRGYYARVKGIEVFVDKFLKVCTSFFFLQISFLHLQNWHNLEHDRNNPGYS